MNFQAGLLDYSIDKHDGLTEENKEKIEKTLEELCIVSQMKSGFFSLSKCEHFKRKS